MESDVITGKDTDRHQQILRILAGFSLFQNIIIGELRSFEEDFCWSF